MFLGKVIGTVVATSKTGKTEGLRILVVEKLDEALQPTGKTQACTDTVKTKKGDIVLTCSSSSARKTSITQGVCTDNTIVAIVDTISSGTTTTYSRNA